MRSARGGGGGQTFVREGAASGHFSMFMNCTVHSHPHREKIHRTLCTDHQYRIILKKVTKST
jgi:hypothetical protein